MFYTYERYFCKKIIFLKNYAIDIIFNTTNQTAYISVIPTYNENFDQT